MFEAFFAGSAAVDQCVSYDIKAFLPGQGEGVRSFPSQGMGQ